MMDSLSVIIIEVVLAMLKFALFTLCVMGACACFGITFNIMYVIGAFLAISALKILFS